MNTTWRPSEERTPHRGMSEVVRNEQLNEWRDAKWSKAHVERDSRNESRERHVHERSESGVDITEVEERDRRDGHDQNRACVMRRRGTSRRITHAHAKRERRRMLKNEAVDWECYWIAPSEARHGRSPSRGGRWRRPEGPLRSKVESLRSRGEALARHPTDRRDLDCGEATCCRLFQGLRRSGRSPLRSKPLNGRRQCLWMERVWLDWEGVAEERSHDWTSESDEWNERHKKMHGVNEWRRDWGTKSRLNEWTTREYTTINTQNTRAYTRILQILWRA